MHLYICKDNIETTEGQILHSGNVYVDQISCKANTGNAGNYYSWPASTAGGKKSSGNEFNSICPRGWQLTVNTAADPKSYYYLLLTIYNSGTSNDSKVRLLPLSFIRSGYYDQGSLIYRAEYGYYWSSTAIGNYAYGLRLRSNGLDPQYNLGYNNKFAGFSLRCVARKRVASFRQNQQKRCRCISCYELWWGRIGQILTLYRKDIYAKC